jgi:ketosteroid isomerase-like protein
VHPFRAVVESGDLSGVPALLAEDVVFHSPVAFAPYRGRALVAGIVEAAFEVFADFRYEKEVADGSDHVLVFRARVGDKEVHGADFLHVGEDGMIDELTVMVRPLSGVTALAAAMRPRVERLLAQPA